MKRFAAIPSVRRKRWSSSSYLSYLSYLSCASFFVGMSWLGPAVAMSSGTLNLDTSNAEPKVEWERFASNNNTLEIESSYLTPDVLQIRARTELSGEGSGCIAAFMHLLEDTERLENSVDAITDASVIAQPDPQTHIVHTKFDAVWPVTDRDMVTRSTWQYDAEAHSLTIHIIDASEEKPEQRNTIRMTDVDASWHLQHTEENTLEVRYQGNSNPKGSIPKSIARSSALNSIEQTFNALQSAITESEYQRDYYSVPCLR
ncbi:hypothetical protein CWE08_07220 [Aliidiomarina iranensis]|uniref:START domain-containing protein n=1 Tax=Aliidiomarina iranensis TaxID=1434071 RepID=A0A432VWE9_9GAMM|nr:START domain-containing protein [Aliidiomarina iranensis]RUO20885.1 hypothetical protein CWE08_07220 [Aliidiomarina iranensis]